MANTDYHEIENFTNNGNLGISYKVFEEITLYAINEIDGTVINQPSSSLFRNTKPVSCTITKKGELDINIYLKIKYGFNVADVCNRVQTKVENDIYAMTEVTPRRINIHIDDFSAK